MKLGVFNPVFGKQSLEDTLKYLNENNVKGIEIGCGGYPESHQIDVEAILSSDEAVKELKELLEKYDVEISALSVHGNPVSPDFGAAVQFHDDFLNACKLAKRLEVKTIITFSGCPGGSKEDKTPNWITCSWPTEYAVSLEYQWNEVLVPYWKEQVEILDEYDLQVAFEMHPGFCVYNPASAKKLFEMVGSKRLGINFDPSHLMWQQIDPILALEELKDRIYHFHAKDVYLCKHNIEKNGVLDTASYGDLGNRSWYFKTVGYGSSDQVWRHMIGKLAEIKYEGFISIEHEDSTMSIGEGLEKAIKYLDQIIIKEKPADAWWF